MPDIVCLGEALVDLVCPTPGLSLVQAPEFVKAAGGAPTNVAAGCALLGASAGLIAQVGRDTFGEYLRQSLWDCGVDLGHFLCTDSHATQLAFVALDGQGRPDFAFHVKQSADQMLSPDDLDSEFIAAAEIFHFGTLTMINEPARSATLKALQIAQEQGLLISFDPNLRAPLWSELDQAREIMIDLAAECDFLKVNEDEMTFITGFENIDSGLQALTEMGPEVVAVTRGPAGCVVSGPAGLVELPAAEVPVLDTTGCGDSFVAASLVRFLESPCDIAELNLSEMEEIFRFASAAAALTSTGPGAIPSLPTREEVYELLELVAGAGDTEGEGDDKGDE
jgi:fructokinase